MIDKRNFVFCSARYGSLGEIKAFFHFCFLLLAPNPNFQIMTALTSILPLTLLCSIRFLLLKYFQALNERLLNSYNGVMKIYFSLNS